MTQNDGRLDGLVRKRTRALRVGQGWSLEEPATRAQLSPSSLSRIETGSSPGPAKSSSSTWVNVATTQGMRGTVHAAAYLRFDDGLITRIEEYANFVPGGDDA